jgi:hypothetical protein
MTTCDRPLLRLTSPPDLLAAVPYLLGYHPADSIVLVGLRGTRSVFHVRTDLPPSGEADAHARHLAGVLAARGIQRILMIGYGPPQSVTSIVLAASQAFRAAGVKVDEALRVTDGRYWSYVCPVPACCPAEGTPFDVSTSRIAAEATLAGCVALPDRSTLERRVAAPRAGALAAIERATELAEERLTERLKKADGTPFHVLRAAGERAVAAAISRYADGGRLDDDELAELSLLLVADAVRDLAWQRIARVPGPLDLQLRLWTDVVARVCPELVASPATLLAFTAWRNGDGALASIAVDRALDTDPGYPLARLMREILDRAVPPPTLDVRQRSGPPRPRRRDRLAG